MGNLVFATVARAFDVHPAGSSVPYCGVSTTLHFASVGVVFYGAVERWWSWSFLSSAALCGGIFIPFLGVGR